MTRANIVATDGGAIVTLGRDACADMCVPADATELAAGGAQSPASPALPPASKRRPASLKQAPQLRVPVMPADKRTIEANAASVGLSVAAFLRDLGLKKPMAGILDHESVLALARVNADMGRLGGLLKLFLTSDDKLQQLGEQRDLRGRVLTLLQRIGETQQQMQAVMERVVR